jgi:hypothetical protein
MKENRIKISDLPDEVLSMIYNNMTPEHMAMLLAEETLEKLDTV